MSGRIYGAPSSSTAFQFIRNEQVRDAFPIEGWVTRDEQQRRIIEVAPMREVNESPKRIELLVDEVTAVLLI